MKELMTGNEAIARGAYEAGAHFAHPILIFLRICNPLQTSDPTSASSSPGSALTIKRWTLNVRC